MWFKVDDSFWGHPKATGISNDSLATWTRAGNWSAWQLTDGAVPVGMLRVCAGDAEDPEAVAADLVDRRLWEVSDDGGWLFHDWPDYNPTRAQVLAKRKKDADRRRDWLSRARAARSTVTHDVSSDVSHGVSHGVMDVLPGQEVDLASGNGVSSTVSHAVDHAYPDPTRPDRREGRTNTGDQSSSGRNAGAHEDDDEELSQVQALMAQAGRPVGREDAARIRDAVIAKGGNVRNRRAFIGRILGDQKQARQYAPGSGPHAPTAREIIDSSKRPGGPGDAGAGAAEARRQLAERTRPEHHEPDAAPGLHGEALARRQLAEIASTRKPVDPPPDDDDPPAEDDPGEEQYPF